MYGWTFHQIADMTHYQQYIALADYEDLEEGLTFNTMREYNDWMVANGK